MSLDKIRDRAPTAREARKERFKRSIETASGKRAQDVIEDLASDASSASEIVDALEDNYGIKTTIPTVLSYLQLAWGKDYDSKMEDMKKARVNRRRWIDEYKTARQGVSEKFYKDYLSTDDGVYFDFEETKLKPLPELTKRAHRGKNIINYSKERDFGWSRDEKDPDALGTWDPTVLGVLIRQLERRVDGLVEDKKKDMVKREVIERFRKTAGITPDRVDEFPQIMRKLKQEVKRDLAEDLEKMNDEKASMMFELLKQVGKGDTRTRFLHGGDVVKDVSGKLMSANMDPAYASSDKKYRGKQRMVALPGEVFSRATYNLPFLLHMHPKRLQVHSHNLSKNLPELLSPEVPRVPAKFNDVPGINARVRFPRNAKEHVETLEAGMIITETLANKFRYFTVVEEDVMIGETKQSFPDAPKLFKSIKSYKDYVKAMEKIDEFYQIDRLDPLTLGEFEDIGYNVGNKFAKHSGVLFLIDEPQARSRKITLEQGENNDTIIEQDYYVQRYQIVREDTLRVGDKILDRGGLKGVVSDIVPDLGKDEKGRPYELVCNFDEVWREEDRSTAAGRLKDDTYHKQGKKKSAIVMEHEAGDGEVFFFMIDKFAQDSTTTGLSFSSTLVSGLWERALDTLETDTKENRDELMDNFTGRFFRGEGSFIPTLKALHYRAVKENGIVRLEIDDKEPTADDYGDVVNLPHTFAGNTYKTAYVPHSVARVYFDGRTFREVFIPQNSTTPNAASDFYWYNIMRQTKNRFRIFPRLDWGIQLVTRPWAEDIKDPTKYHTVMMDYLDVYDMGADPYDKNLQITFRKEPVTSGHSVQTHPVKVDFTGKYRGTIGLNPIVALKATIDYDGDTVTVFHDSIVDAVSELEPKELNDYNSILSARQNKSFKDLYSKARNTTYAKDEKELGVMAASYNQTMVESENELIERLGGLRRRALILQGINQPIKAKLAEGTKYEEPITFDMKTINKITDVEKILKMREPRWKVRIFEQKKIDDLTPDEWDLVRDSYARKTLNKILSLEIQNPSVRVLYDLIRDDKSFVQETARKRDADPLGLKLDIKNKLIDRILYNELLGSDILEDKDKQ